jgi:predicted PurR-regulated permease PerM
LESLDRRGLSQRSLLILAAMALCLLVIHQLRPILPPFVIGALIAYLGDPLTDRLETLGCSRGLAAISVFTIIGLFMLLALVFMVPLLANQLDALVRGLPALYQWIAESALPWVQQRLDLPEQSLPGLRLKQTLADNWQSVGKMVASVARYVSGSGVNFLVFLGNLVLIPVVAFYLLRDWDKLMPRMLALLPRQWQDKAMSLAVESDEVIGAFLRGQFLVMLALGFIYSLGLWLVGLELAILIGSLAGLASIVPYLGTAVGIIAATAATVLQFQDLGMLLWVGLVFGIGQMIEGYLLTPMLVGDRIGLHPVAVIFAILAGGQLAGFTGVLLALPLAAVLMVFLRHLHEYYTDSEFYTGVEPESDD